MDGYWYLLLVREMKKFAAEMLGTAILVFIGCGSAVIAGKQIGFLGIALAFGLVLLTMVYAIGSISGCHVNPAVSIAMLVAGKMNVKDAVGYIVAQCIGAIIAAGLLLVIASGQAGYTLGMNGLGQNGYGVASPGGYSLAACALAEVLLTAMFVFVIFGSLSKDAPKGFAGLAIGFALGMVHIVGIPLTGTSVNPARSLGPAVFVGGTALAQLWLFIVAPVIGGILAALVWKYAFEPAPQ
jgi:aquaporin Z